MEALKIWWNRFLFNIRYNLKASNTKISSAKKGIIFFSSLGGWLITPVTHSPESLTALVVKTSPTNPKHLQELSCICESTASCHTFFKLNVNLQTEFPWEPKRWWIAKNILTNFNLFFHNWFATLFLPLKRDFHSLISLSSLCNTYSHPFFMNN